MTVETEGGIPPITYSWSVDGTIVQSGPSNTYVTSADKRVGNHTVSCSAVGSNRDLVSCNSTLTVNGIDPILGIFNVFVDSGGDIPAYINLKDMFQYFGTEPMDYEYVLDPTPSTGQPQVYKNGNTTTMEFSGRVEPGFFEIVATNKTNTLDHDSLDLNIVSASSAVYANDPVAISSGGIVRLDELFRFIDCSPSDFAIAINPYMDGTSLSDDVIIISNGSFEGTMQVRVTAGNTERFQQGLYEATNYIVVTNGNI